MFIDDSEYIYSHRIGDWFICYYNPKGIIIHKDGIFLDDIFEDVEEAEAYIELFLI